MSAPLFYAVCCSDLFLPEPVEVAVGVHRLDLLAVRQGEHGPGLLAGMEPVHQGVPLGLHGHPLDEMLLRHGMGHGAHFHGDAAVRDEDRGHVLFNRRVGDAGLQQLHGLAAAVDGHLGRGQLGDDVAAMSANIKLHNLSLLLFDRVDSLSVPILADSDVRICCIYNRNENFLEIFCALRRGVCVPWAGKRLPAAFFACFRLFARYGGTSGAF